MYEQVIRSIIAYCNRLVIFIILFYAFIFYLLMFLCLNVLMRLFTFTFMNLAGALSKVTSKRELYKSA